MERTDDRDIAGIRSDPSHVLGAPIGVRAAVDRIVEDAVGRHLERHASAPAGITQCEPYRIQDRRGRRLSGERKLDREQQVHRRPAGPRPDHDHDDDEEQDDQGGRSQADQRRSNRAR